MKRLFSSATVVIFLLATTGIKAENEDFNFSKSDSEFFKIDHREYVPFQGAPPNQIEVSVTNNTKKWYEGKISTDVLVHGLSNSFIVAPGETRSTGIVQLEKGKRQFVKITLLDRSRSEKAGRYYAVDMVLHGIFPEGTMNLIKFGTVIPGLYGLLHQLAIIDEDRVRKLASLANDPVKLRENIDSIAEAIDQNKDQISESIAQASGDPGSAKGISKGIILLSMAEGIFRYISESMKYPEIDIVSLGFFPKGFQPNSFIIVTAQGLHIRTGPGENYSYLHHLSPGDKGVILAHPDNGVRVGSFRWWYVRIEHIYSDGSGRVETFTGWVAEGPEDAPYIQSADDVHHSLIPGEDSEDSDELEPDPDPDPAPEDDPVYNPPAEPSPPTSFVKLEPLAITLTPAEPEKLVPAELGGQVNGQGTYSIDPFPDWFYHESEGSSLRLGVVDYSRVETSQTFVFIVSSSNTMRYRDLEVSIVSPEDWEKQLEDARYLDVPEEYQSVDSALAKAQSGQTVRVATGEYNLSNLHLRDNVTLEGNNSVFNFSSGEGSVLRTGAKGVRISNLTLKGIGKDRTRTYGLYLYDGAEVKLDNISFLDFYDGIESQARPSNGQGVSVLIRNNLFKDCHQGISSLGGATLEIRDSQFLNNQQAGLYIYNPASVLLEGLQVSGSEKAIILQEGQKEPAILKKLIIQNNREGVYLEQSWAEISDSDVSDNQGTGILVRGRIRLTNTTILNNGTGLYLGYSSTEMDRETKEVNHCQITDNKEVGIQIYHKGYGQTRVSIFDSDIFNNQGGNLNLIDQTKTCSVNLTDIFFNSLDEKAVRQTITVPDDKQLNLANIRSQGAVDSSLEALPVKEPESEVTVVRVEDQSSTASYIAFQRGNGLYLLNSETGEVVALLLNPAVAIDNSKISWFGNGETIVFQARTSSNNLDIYQLNLKTRELIGLTTWPRHDYDPSISPKGDELAFVSDRGQGWKIYLMDLETKEVRRLTNNSDWVDETCPSFSPDGNQLAYCLDKRGSQDIWLINTDGSNDRRLTSHSATDSYPAWSPDGGQIVFASTRDQNWEIYLIDQSGGGKQRLTNNKGDDYRPSFSPDGEQVVFYSDRDGNGEIYLMAKDGSNQLNLTNSPNYEGSPAWSPLTSINLSAAPAQVQSKPGPPSEDKLLQNYPNPANPDTWIPFQLKEESQVVLLIHDVKGTLIRAIPFGLKPAGVYAGKDKAIHWDGRNDRGEPVASGIYFYTLQTNHFASTKKMIIRR